MNLSPSVKKAISAGALLLLTSFAVLKSDQKLNATRAAAQLQRRAMSVDLGNGNCQYEPPISEVDPNLNLYKYLLAGFPSGDKRMAYVQYETLTGLPSKDDWDFVYNGYTNAPFIKTNYPHPSSTWSWGSEANEVALVVQFIRRNMVEYADIVWYQNTSPSYENERWRVERKYGQRLPENDWYRWRDERVLQEIYRYGSYIDYWMENGLRRDPISHMTIDQKLWEVLTHPKPVPRVEEAHICHKTSSPSNPAIDMVVAPEDVQVYIDHGDYLGLCAEAKKTGWWSTAPPSYMAARDPLCNTISNSCRPQIVVSADKLRDYTAGPAETAAIGRRLQKRMSQYVVNESAWLCIWDQLIDKNAGPMTFDDRSLVDEPAFSAFMLGEMLYEVNRLIAKYSASAWTSSNDKAVRLVSLFQEHKALLETEIASVSSGARTLKESDFLGPAGVVESETKVSDGSK